MARVEGTRINCDERASIFMFVYRVFCSADFLHGMVRVFTIGPAVVWRTRGGSMDRHAGHDMHELSPCGRKMLLSTLHRPSSSPGYRKSPAEHHAGLEYRSLSDGMTIAPSSCLIRFQSVFPVPYQRPTRGFRTPSAVPEASRSLSWYGPSPGPQAASRPPVYKRCHRL